MNAQKTILLVEDQKSITLVEKSLLEKLGYRVFAAMSGSQAMETLGREGDIDLILMDIELGEGLSGIDLAKIILAEMDIPIIFLSSHSEADIIRMTEDVGSYGYIIKKNAVNVLNASIRMALKLFETTRELKAVNAKQEATLDALPDLLFEVGLDGYIHDFHSPSKEYLGEQGPEIIGKNIRDIHPASISEVILEAVEEADRDGRSSGKQFMLDVPAGKCWFEISVSPKIVSFQEPHFIILKREITARKNAESEIMSLLAEKELILKEVHHRIKNNMNTVYGLLLLQSRTLADRSAVSALEEAANRIKSMMLIYDKLYKSGHYTEVSVAEYLPALIEAIIENHSGRDKITVRTEIDDFILETKHLQPVAIIINELLTNIMKYAFTGREKGTIYVSATLQGTDVTMVVADDGNGIPESVSFEKSTGFGLVLVNGLTAQLGGTISIERGQGTRFVLRFEK